MEKRLHRQLKTAQRAVEDPGNWSDNLPLALVGIRTALKSDLGCGAAELVFGTTLRLPGEMIPLTSRGTDETPDNVRNAKTCRLLRGDKEDVVSFDRVRAAVAEEPPDLEQRQNMLIPLFLFLYLPYPLFSHPAYCLALPLPCSLPLRPAYFLSLHVNSIQLQHHRPP
nr:unnamed protein product [Spirometra erinaceieuropaei]